MANINSKLAALREYFGHRDFHEGQESVIDAILSGRDALAVMPTGAGKSVCYQIPALLLEGMTVVVSPLISLMKDQVSALIQNGIRAAYLNTSLTQQQYGRALDNARQGMYKIIYVAPERLCTPSFLSLAAYVRISMLAVDEAHCVSQWGPDFRPSYFKIPEFLAHLNYRPVVSAFTATATPQVREDIIQRLGLAEPFCITTGFNRENLYFGVRHVRDKYAEVKAIVTQNKDKSGIIYCATRKAADSVCAQLNQDGIPCVSYHAGLSDADRRNNQDAFIYDRVQVIAATNAFGMGIDKSNVAYVIHYNMPKNLENYYQEAGRAGRDGGEAQCVILYSAKDIITNRYLIENSNENPNLSAEELETLRRRDMQKLNKMNDYCNTDRCLRQFILDYFGETKQCECQNCSNCSGETELVDITLEAQKILSCVYRLGQRNLRFGGSVAAQVLKGSQSEKVKKFGLESLSTFGIMSDCAEVKIRSIIRFLTAEGYLAEVCPQGTAYSVLTLTSRSGEVLFGKKSVSMRQPKTSSSAENAGNISNGRGKRQRSADKGQVTRIDTELFGRLKALRKRLADSEGVPPYIVFGDAALRDMCIKLPRSQADFLEVSGVGRVKQEKYGSDFTREIIKYLNEGRSQNGDNGDISDLLSYVALHRGELAGCSDELSLSRMGDDILSQLGIDGDRKLLTEAIRQWLIAENYLTEMTENGQKSLAATVLSGQVGIVEQEKVSVRGTAYRSVVFPREAQVFVYQSLGDIAGSIKN